MFVWAYELESTPKLYTCITTPHLLIDIWDICMILNLCSWNINFLLPNQTICMFVCLFFCYELIFLSLLVVWALSLTALFFLVSLLFVCLSKLYVWACELESTPLLELSIKLIIGNVSTFKTSFQSSGHYFNVQTSL